MPTKDPGTFRDEFSATVPRHGAVFVKIGSALRQAQGEAKGAR